MTRVRTVSAQWFLSLVNTLVSVSMGRSTQRGAIRPGISLPGRPTDRLRIFMLCFCDSPATLTIGGSLPNGGNVMTNEYTGWNRPMLVTLTATSNTFLQGSLPVRGLLRVVEMRTDGYAQPRKVLFQQIADDNTAIGSQVAVDDAEFTYSLPGGRG